MFELRKRCAFNRFQKAARGKPGHKPNQRHSRLGLEPLEDRIVLSASYLPSEVLVQFYDVGENVRAAARNNVRAVLKESIHTSAMTEANQGALERVGLPAGLSVEAAIKKFKNLPGVAYVEPNWILTTSYVSNDPYYTTSSRLWGMYSDDSPALVGPSGTSNQYGSQAEEAWNEGHVGSKSVYVGIVDTGFQNTHPDLDGNSWTNPFEVAGDGIDNDGNGYIDDVYGWDFHNNDNSTYDPSDGDSHGTHVAGTIGAEGGNAVGVAGVNWNVTMIAAKFLGPNGGYTSNAVKALDYLTDLKTRHGIDIVASNNSWGGGGYSTSLHNSILRAAKADILFVAAAGNDSSNNDNVARYPTNYSTLTGTTTVSAASYEAVISVASITSSGALSSFSNYGATTVDLGAPGSAIYSTVPGGYASYSGTSMATPHVTGAAALYAAAQPAASAREIREALLNSATPMASLAGKTVTGGRLNVSAAMGQEPVAGISINNVALAEGNSGTTSFVFTVTLSAASTQSISVNYATANGSASTSKNDYYAASGSLTFSPGQTAKTITVAVRGDTTSEKDEVFYVDLSNASGAAIADSQGVGTILNDDTATKGNGKSQPSGKVALGAADVEQLSVSLGGGTTSATLRSQSEVDAYFGAAADSASGAGLPLEDQILNSPATTSYSVSTQESGGPDPTLDLLAPILDDLVAGRSQAKPRR